MIKVKSYIKTTIKYKIPILHKVIMLIYSFLLSCASIMPIKIQSLSSYKIIIVLFLFGLVYLSIWFLYKNIKYCQNNKTSNKKKYLKLNKWFYIFLFIAFSSINLIVLLANYPGLGSSDSEDIICQAINFFNNTGQNKFEEISAHHSVFYTLLFWLILNITNFINDIHFSIFIFLVIQILLISLFVCLSISWASKILPNKTFLIILIILLTLNPVLISYASKFLKDVPFSILIVVLSLFLYNLSNKKKTNIKDYLFLGILMLLICLLRNTGILICLISLIYIFILNILNRSKILVLTIVLATLMLLIWPQLFNSLGIKKANFVESAGIPLQQIARTVKYDGNINTNEKEFINSIMQIDKLSVAYLETNVDTIKFSKDFNNEFLENNKFEFLCTWIKLFPRNINHYIPAWAWTTYGYWSPYRAAGIAGNHPIMTEHTTNYIGITLLPSKLCNFIPYRIIFNNSGLLIWILIAYLMLLKMLNNDRWKDFLKHIIWFIPILSVFLILLLASPKADEFRYILSLYLIIPFLPCFWKSNFG